MSEHMAGNPHYREADRSELDEVPFVIAQAILALAYEQRTANLIAWQLQPRAIELPEYTTARRADIVARLGGPQK
jgi:hypothetical protein